LQAELSVIKEVRGLGLMWGLELTQEGTPMVAACRERGLLVNCTQGNVIRLLPPLIITDQELDAALAILAKAFKAVFP
jgi:acetylornithine/N-succinyldiaminopimelate aminotransferase